MKNQTKSFEVITKCPVCRGVQFKKIITAKDYLVKRGESFPLVKCVDCNLFYLQKRPTKENIGSYYPEVYEPYNINDHDFYIELQNRLMTAYFKKKKNPVDHFMGFIYKTIYGIFPMAGKKRLRVLDIGCGNGLFIHNLEKVGCDVYGIDMSKSSINFAKRKLKLKNVKVGDVENLNYKKEFFDVIVMNHIIEHVYDPIKLVRSASRLLKKGGTMVVATPNISSINFSIFSKDWFPLETPRHLTLFNPKSMTKLAGICGLRIKTIFHDRSSHALQRSLKYKFDKNFTILKPLLLPTTFAFSLLGKSDIATYHLVKNFHSIK